MDPGLNQLLQWSIKNSSTDQPNPANETETENGTQPQARGLTTEALRALMGGPSEADLMKAAMSHILSPEPDLASKMIAFDNLEQLVENIDNANNITPLGLWAPLISQLSAPEPDLRRMAAWVIGTAVQNNEKAQMKFLEHGGMEQLVKLAVGDENRDVRRKAIYALSSEVRNFQPGMDEAVRRLPKNVVGPDQLSATDMDVIDAIMAKLREG